MKGAVTFECLIRKFLLREVWFFSSKEPPKYEPLGFYSSKGANKTLRGWFSAIFGMGVGCGQFFSITNYSSFVFACLCFNNQLSGNKGEVGSHY